MARMAATLRPPRLNASRIPSYTAASLLLSACCSIVTVTLARQLSVMSATTGGGGSMASSALATALMLATAPAFRTASLNFNLVDQTFS